MATTKRKPTTPSTASAGKFPSTERLKKVSRAKPATTKECEIVNIPYYTDEVDVNKIGPSIAVCTELLDQLGHDEMLAVIKKYGKNFIEENKYAHLPKKQRIKLEREREKKWSSCPDQMTLCKGGSCVGGYCACGMNFPLNASSKAHPEPGSIGVSLNHIAFHTNVPSEQILPPADPCILKLGKFGDTQCITLQYEPEPVKKIPAPPFYERQIQVNESELGHGPKRKKTKGKKGKKKGKGKSKKGKGKSKGKGKAKSKGKSKKGKGKSKKGKK